MVVGRTQAGVGSMAVMKTAVTAAALGATAYSRTPGLRVEHGMAAKAATEVGAVLLVGSSHRP
jgi:hypothetical protein